MERYYNIAGLNISIVGNAQEMYKDGKMFDAFEVLDAPESGPAIRFVFEVKEILDAPEGECVYKEPAKRIYLDEEKEIRYIGAIENNLKDAYLRVERNGTTANVQVNKAQMVDVITPKIVLNALGIERLAVEANGCILHVAYIIHDGKGILFTAPSGVGKSTQAELWKELRGAEIVNGDRAVVRLVDDTFCVCGIPFSGSSKYCENVTVPIDAIVYLRQARQTQVERIKGKDAFCKILEGVSFAAWSRSDTEKVLTLIQTLIQNVPVYQLSCTPDESAVIALENELRKEW